MERKRLCHSLISSLPRLPTSLGMKTEVFSSPLQGRGPGDLMPPSDFLSYYPPPLFQQEQPPYMAKLGLFLRVRPPRGTDVETGPECQSLIWKAKEIP